MATITILQQPANTALYRAYQPLVYKVSVGGVTNPPVMAAQLFINGVIFGTPQKTTHIGYNAGAGEYLFKFDATLLLRDFFENGETWGALQAQTDTILPNVNAANSGYSKKCEFRFEFTAYAIVSPNPTQQEQSPKVYGNFIKAINAKADTTVGDLSNYYGTGAALPYFFMCNSPRNGNTINKEAFFAGSDFLSYHINSEIIPNGVAEVLQVDLYNNLGVLYQTGYIVATAPSTKGRIRQMGAGIANINNTAALQWINPLLPAYITNVTAYYEVSVVIYDSNISAVSQIVSHPVRYNISQKCPQIQLFYTNEFGAADSLNFDYSDSSISYENEQNSYTLPTGDIIPTASTRGAKTLNTNAVLNFTLNRDFSQRERKRIQEAWNSPLLAIVLPDNLTQYVAVINTKMGEVFLKNEQKTKNNKISVQFVLQQAARDFGQQN